jgi:uncharacterized repeat protein (TIGR03803 family)
MKCSLLSAAKTAASRGTGFSNNRHAGLNDALHLLGTSEARAPQSRVNWNRLCVSTFLCFLLFFAKQSFGQYQVLYEFGSGTTPYGPSGSLLQSGQLLYGTTDYGGSNDWGTIFSYNTSTGALNTLYSFTNVSPAGYVPVGTPIMVGPTLYGYTAEGGSKTEGTIYSYNTNTGTESDAYSFGSGAAEDLDANGENYGDALLQVGTSLYGLSTRGGANFTGNTGDGTIFSYNTSSNTETVNYSFTGFGSSAPTSPGGNALVQSGALLYGLAGGGTNVDGTIFSYNPSGAAVNTLHSFGPTESGDGIDPGGALAKSGSVLYGVTGAGGAYDHGTIFSYDTSDGDYNVVYSFGKLLSESISPYGALDPTGTPVILGNDLYGLADSGGPDVTDGALYEINLLTDTETDLHFFTGNGTLDGGTLADESLILDGSTLYGMTGLLNGDTGSGTYGGGVLFSYALPEPSSASLLVFCGLGPLSRRRPGRRAKSVQNSLMLA